MRLRDLRVEIRQRSAERMARMGKKTMKDSSASRPSHPKK
jgi:hypothetical protein